MKVDRKKLVKAIESVIYNGVSEGEEIDITTNNIMTVVAPLISAVEAISLQPEWVEVTPDIPYGTYDFWCGMTKRRLVDIEFGPDDLPLPKNWTHYKVITQPPTK